MCESTCSCLKASLIGLRLMPSAALTANTAGRHVTEKGQSDGKLGGSCTADNRKIRLTTQHIVLFSYDVRFRFVCSEVRNPPGPLHQALLLAQHGCQVWLTLAWLKTPWRRVSVYKRSRPAVCHLVPQEIVQSAEFMVNIHVSQLGDSEGRQDP